MVKIEKQMKEAGIYRTGFMKERLERQRLTWLHDYRKLGKYISKHIWDGDGDSESNPRET